MDEIEVLAVRLRDALVTAFQRERSDASKGRLMRAIGYVEQAREQIERAVKEAGK